MTTFWGKVRNGSQDAGWSDCKGEGEPQHSKLAAGAAGALLGDDAVAGFGYAEDEGGAGDCEQGAGDPGQGEC